jgi:hypothetical protein
MSISRVEAKRLRTGDAERLFARGLRDADRREARRISGMSAEEAAANSVAASDAAGMLWVDGLPVALFGVARAGLVGRAGVPWLTAHPDFERRETAVVMFRLSRKFIECWLREYGVLENIADPENRVVCRYLRHLGFVFDWSNPVRGPFGHRLVRFVRRV